MKKIVASVGLVALGASGINTIHAQDLSAPSNKPWNISASLRGFYDDNINTTTVNKQSSFGAEIEPGASLNWGNDQTSVKLGYTYGLKYFEKRPAGNSSNYDQNHTFNGSLRHAFNERYELSVGDTFALGQEPDLLRNDNSGFITDPIRLPGDNYRNYGTLIFNAQLTPLFGVEVGYANELAMYADSGAVVVSNKVGEVTGGGFVEGPSRAGLMDRIDQSAHVNGQWQMTPQTVGIVGYELGVDNYTADEPITIITNGVPRIVRSGDRDAFHNKFYVGLNHTFRPDLYGSIQGGASVYDYYNNVGTDSKTKVSPYIKGNLRYTYAVESYAEVGLNYDRSPTDALRATGGSYTRDAQDLVLFASLYHRIIPNLYGSLVAQLQNATFNGGANDNQNELYYSLGLDLKYRFTPHFSANAGYNFDKLDSDTRKYDRNQIYLGVTATY